MVNHLRVDRMQCTRTAQIPNACVCHCVIHSDYATPPKLFDVEQKFTDSMSAVVVHPLPPRGRQARWIWTTSSARFHNVSNCVDSQNQN
jgi:hypothetical protein